MPDVLQKCIPANTQQNGSIVVSTNIFGTITNYKVAPTINKLDTVTAQSGILDSRFDEVRYYSGDTSA
jgi:hypothetical protein